jgi:site-specific recombinase XerD
VHNSQFCSISPDPTKYKQCNGKNTALAGGSGYIGHLGINDVQRIMTADAHVKHGERNSLLIELLFESCLKISELLELMLDRIDKTSNRILAKNLKSGKDKPVEISWVGISKSIKNQRRVSESMLRHICLTRYRRKQ